jgi:2-polyprenyl-3-methyl-5-hydroxy-6-metoxy-1,4-benzoquinol methylase
MNSKFPNMRWEGEVASFETFALNQLPADTEEDFDIQYFTGAWRHGKNSYTLASRREIEGKNPELIRDILKPKNILDAGCGPGLLVLMMREIGLNAEGIDMSSFAIQTAPESVRSYISKGSILQLPHRNAEFDLVICREVLEHLTVIEVAKAISELCRTSSRLVYVTTRYAHDSKTLFDVETEFEADPTHITCANKSLLRLLFILQGFRSRPDLEKLLDWQNKGRVLIYERTDKAIC